MKLNKLMATALTSLTLTAGSAFADTISIRADDWFPMNGDPNSATPGYMIELATKIFGDAGHTVEYRTMPWERAVSSVREGQFNCVVGAYKEDAPDFIFPNESWGLDEQAFFVTKDESWRYENVGSLDSAKIGVVGGYAYNEDIDGYIKANAKGNIQETKGDKALEKNIKKVLAKRITTTIESLTVMNAQLKDMGQSGALIKAGSPGEASDMYIACSPAKDSSKDLIKLVDEGTSKLRASGELQNILGKYGLSDWK